MGAGHGFEPVLENDELSRRRGVPRLAVFIDVSECPEMESWKWMN